MLPAGVRAINKDAVMAIVGPQTYARGLQYALTGAVTELSWDDDAHVLFGVVKGSGANVYETFVLVETHGNRCEFVRGQCACPVGYNCKHAVALVVAASQTRQSTAQNLTTASELAATAPPATWEQSLAPLTTFGYSPAERRRDSLAVELTLEHEPRSRWTRDERTQRRLVPMLRIMRPGKNGWINGGLSWNKLPQLAHRDEYVATHVRLLQELYALYNLRTRTVGYTGYTYGDQKMIDLSLIESRQLWPILDEADTAGLRFLHSNKNLGAVAPYGTAELVLDVTSARGQDHATVSPLLQVDGVQRDAVPIRFIGAAADVHGVVYADGDRARSSNDERRWRLRLARLTGPIPPDMQKMLLDAQKIEIPGDELDKFRDEFCPRLRHQATVISSDKSFEPPAVSEPMLVLCATYSPGHRVDLDWEWEYKVGDSGVRVPYEPQADDGFRDVEAEVRLVESLNLPLEPEDARTTLLDFETVRFTLEILPLLSDHPGVIVEINGELPDYREAGDSLRIGLKTNDVAGEKDWFDLEVTVSVEGRAVSFAAVFTALSKGQEHMLLPDGAYFSLQKPKLQALRRLIEESRALTDAPPSALSISRFQADLWDEMTQLAYVDSQAEQWQRQVDGLLDPAAVESVRALQPPKSFTAQLRPYQLDGFRWLSFLWEHQLGGILADDMGLGKTVQSLALIAHAREREPEGAPFVIVAPTSVVPNWKRESERFAPALNVVALTDTLKRRKQTLAEAIGDADVVVTSHTLLRLDVDAYCELPWAGMILDEAQFVKNYQSRLYQAVRKVKAPFKLAVTGTPMENNLMELWSLLSITAPGLFPNPGRFREYYATPIEKGGNAELLAQLRRRIKPLVKRRLKESVVEELPEKQEQVLEIELHPKHRKIYQTHLQRERQKILGLIDDINKNRFTILRSLTVLRQLSLHAGLVDDEYESLPSAKVDALIEQLHDVIDGGHRALVFSQFTGFLNVVRARLESEDIQYVYLDGRTRKRADVLETFKEGSAPVFLISLKAGGFGLNLTEADYCFVLDPWWNPASETQAIDRTHRIGQTRNVMVYRLIAKDTIEEKVMALKARKSELFAGVMDDGNTFGAALGADDIRGLFDAQKTAPHANRARPI